MIASNGQMETLFKTFHLANATCPGQIMSDRDVGQINALSIVWDGAMIYLCWWHVLHAWHQHLRIEDHPEVWELLKGWVRNDTVEKFNATWLKIEEKAPRPFLEYLKEYWLPGASKLCRVRTDQWSLILGFSDKVPPTLQHSFKHMF
jgi:hypothetical protein